MDYRELPTSTTVGSSVEPEVLETLARSVLRVGGVVTHYSPISGLQRSGRIFGCGSFADAIPIPRSWNAAEIAQQLVLFGKEARYASPSVPGTQKGWEIRRCVINRAPGLIALALWV